MSDRPSRFSRRRFPFVWKLVKTLRADQRAQFERAMRLLDEAGEIMPLRASDRVWRALLLLKAQRLAEARKAFVALREEFKDSVDPNLRYLRHFCTHKLSMMTPSSGQWSYEAKQAKLLDCDPNLKRRFRMVTVDEIYEGIQPRS